MLRRCMVGAGLGPRRFATGAWHRPYLDKRIPPRRRQPQAGLTSAFYQEPAICPRQRVLGFPARVGAPQTAEMSRSIPLNPWPPVSELSGCRCAVDAGPS